MTRSCNFVFRSLLPSKSTKPVKKKEEDETFETAEKKLKLFVSLEGHRDERDWNEQLMLSARALILIKVIKEALP